MRAQSSPSDLWAHRCALALHRSGGHLTAGSALRPGDSQAPTLLLLLGMKNNKTNQERGRKYGGSSSFVDMGQPSKAPRQDEEGAAVGSTSRAFGPADGTSPKQGISNRPAKDEHAFPDADESDSQAVPDSVDDGPKQVGGNRGQV
jgi:hypothetical protein